MMYEDEAENTLPDELSFDAFMNALSSGGTSLQPNESRNKSPVKPLASPDMNLVPNLLFPPARSPLYDPTLDGTAINEQEVAKKTPVKRENEASAADGDTPPQDDSDDFLLYLDDLAATLCEEVAAETDALEKLCEDSDEREVAPAQEDALEAETDALDNDWDNCVEADVATEDDALDELRDDSAEADLAAEEDALDKLCDNSADAEVAAEEDALEKLCCNSAEAGVAAETDALDRLWDDTEAEVPAEEDALNEVYDESTEAEVPALDQLCDESAETGGSDTDTFEEPCDTFKDTMMEEEEKATDIPPRTTLTPPAGPKSDAENMIQLRLELEEARAAVRREQEARRERERELNDHIAHLQETVVTQNAQLIVNLKEELEFVEEDLDEALERIKELDNEKNGSSQALRNECATLREQYASVLREKETLVDQMQAEAAEKEAAYEAEREVLMNREASLSAALIKLQSTPSPLDTQTLEEFQAEQQLAEKDWAEAMRQVNVLTAGHQEESMRLQERIDELKSECELLRELHATELLEKEAVIEQLQKEIAEKEAIFRSKKESMNLRETTLAETLGKLNAAGESQGAHDLDIEMHFIGEELADTPEQLKEFTTPSDLAARHLRSDISAFKIYHASVVDAKDACIATLRHEVSDVKAANMKGMERLSEQVAELQAEMASERAQVTMLNEDLELTDEDLAEALKQIHEKDEVIAALTSELDLTKEETQRLRLELDAKQQCEDQRKTEMCRLKEELEENVQTIKTLKEDFEFAEEEVVEALEEIDELKRASVCLTKDATDLTLQRDHAISERDEALVRVLELEAAMARLQCDHQSEVEKIEGLSVSISELEEERARQAAQISCLRSNDQDKVALQVQFFRQCRAYFASREESLKSVHEVEKALAEKYQRLKQIENPEMYTAEQVDLSRHLSVPSKPQCTSSVEMTDFGCQVTPPDKVQSGTAAHASPVSRVDQTPVFGTPGQPSIKDTHATAVDLDSSESTHAPAQSTTNSQCDDTALDPDSHKEISIIAETAKEDNRNKSFDVNNSEKVISHTFDADDTGMMSPQRPTLEISALKNLSPITASLGTSFDSGRENPVEAAVRVAPKSPKPVTATKTSAYATSKPQVPIAKSSVGSGPKASVTRKRETSVTSRLTSSGQGSVKTMSLSQNSKVRPSTSRLPPSKPSNEFSKGKVDIPRPGVRNSKLVGRKPPVPKSLSATKKSNGTSKSVSKPVTSVRESRLSQLAKPKSRVQPRATSKDSQRQKQGTGIPSISRVKTASGLTKPNGLKPRLSAHPKAMPKEITDPKRKPKVGTTRSDSKTGEIPPASENTVPPSVLRSGESKSPPKSVGKAGPSPKDLVKNLIYSLSPEKTSTERSFVSSPCGFPLETIETAQFDSPTAVNSNSEGNDEGSITPGGTHPSESVACKRSLGDEYQQSQGVQVASTARKRLKADLSPMNKGANTPTTLFSSQYTPLVVRNVTMCVLSPEESLLSPTPQPALHSPEPQAPKSLGASILIQSLARGYICRKHLRKLQRSVIVLQTLFRATLVSREFLVLKKSSVLVQANWRGAISRQRFVSIKSSALVIQRTIRGCLARRCMKARVAAARCIQRVVRGNKSRATALLTRSSLIVIQSLARRWLAQRKLVSAKLSATAIQTWLRAHRAQNRFLATKRATVVLQCALRSHIARKYVLGMVVTRKAATCIQRFVRGAQAREVAAGVLASVVMVQSAMRQWLAQRKLVSAKLSATAIQTWLRAHRAQNRFLATKRATVVLQCALRSHIARKYVLGMVVTRKAATCIQRFVRGAQAREVAAGVLASVVMVQSAMRKWLAQRQLTVMKSNASAATVIQKNWRCAKSRMQFTQMKELSVRIQAYTRGFLCRSILFQKHTAAKLLQSIWRAKMARGEYHQMREIGRKIAAALVIQRHWKGFRQECQFIRLRRCVVSLQRKWRNSQRLTRDEESESPLVSDTVAVVDENQTANITSPSTKSEASSTVAVYDENQTANITQPSSKSQSKSARRPLQALRHHLNVFSPVKTRHKRNPSKAHTPGVENLANTAHPVEIIDLSSTVKVKQDRSSVEKMKVVELREALQEQGVDMKSIRKLRKAALVDLYLETHG